MYMREMTGDEFQERFGKAIELSFDSRYFLLGEAGAILSTETGNITLVNDDELEMDSLEEYTLLGLLGETAIESSDVPRHPFWENEIRKEESEVKRITMIFWALQIVGVVFAAVALLAVAYILKSTLP